jgi:hypothetical protein
MPDEETITVRRDTIQVLVDSLEDMPWMQAARALDELRMALMQEPQPEDAFPTFGSS